MSDCIFCDIIAGNAPASFVYRDDRVCAFMDLRPVNPGHVLVIPNAHAAYLVELDPEDGAQMFRVGQQLAAAVRNAGVRCDGVNLVLADGAPAGQEIFHVHLHVIPRWHGDGSGFRFGTRTENLPLREELELLANRINKCLDA